MMEVQRFDCGNMSKMHYGITFDFYPQNCHVIKDQVFHCVVEGVF